MSLFCHVVNIDYYLQFSYHTPYQHETPISALGLIWVSRVDMGYDMKIAI